MFDSWSLAAQAALYSLPVEVRSVVVEAFSFLLERVLCVVVDDGASAEGEFDCWHQ